MSIIKLAILGLLLGAAVGLLGAHRRWSFPQILTRTLLLWFLACMVPMWLAMVLT